MRAIQSSSLFFPQSLHPLSTTPLLHPTAGVCNSERSPLRVSVWTQSCCRDVTGTLEYSVFSYKCSLLICLQIFEGNGNYDTPELRIVEPLLTRFIRIYPERATPAGMGLRLELLGCEIEGIGGFHVLGPLNSL